jgi:hypothetical protein
MSKCHDHSETGIEAEASQRKITSENPNILPNWNNISEIWNTPVEDLPPPPIGSLGTTSAHSSTSNPFNDVTTSDLPQVYPYLPAPTLQLEDDQAELETSPRGSPLASTTELPIISTTSISGAPRISQSVSTPPRTIHSTTGCTQLHNSPWSTKTRISNDEDSSTSPSSVKGMDPAPQTLPMEGSTSPHLESSVPRCSSTYRKGVLCTSHDREVCHCHILQGQIWQGGVGNRKWRRNQWVLESTLSVSNQADDATRWET